MNTEYMTRNQVVGLLNAALKDLTERNTLAVPPCESCGKSCKARPSAAVMDFCPKWVWRKESRQ